MPEPRVFDIGVALAGGSTRGAYSAGVVDFLFQALNALEGSPNAPPWRIRLKTLAGTSAGGITAAIAASTICTPHTPLSNTHSLADNPEHNNLFDLWVRSVCLENLFDTSDLDLDQARRDDISHIPVKSVLNSNFMEIYAPRSLSADSTDLPSPAWAKNLHLFITTSNLRGIPYAVDNFHCDNKDFREHRMTRHRDWVGFATAPSTFAGLHSLDLSVPRNNPMWNNVSAAAKATAALPLVFPAQRISAPREMYDLKIADEVPDWPDNMSDTYEYDAVDGGVFRNEPLGLVRACLEHGSDQEVLSDDPTRTRGAMILLHPAPRADNFQRDYNPEPCTMFTGLRHVFGALVCDANFQEDELIEDINNDRDISKFMIAPVRDERESDQEVLATDTLRGFGGIIDEEVRLHDFKLGRHNCQRFLQTRFVIPLETALRNPLFGKDALKYAVETPDGRKVVPILPLFGIAAEPCPLPKWPKFNESRRQDLFDKIHNRIKARIQQVISCYAHNLGFYRKAAFSFGYNTSWNFVVDRLVGMATSRAMTQVDEQVKLALKNFS